MQGKKGGRPFLISMKMPLGLHSWSLSCREKSELEIYIYIYLELVTFGQALREQRLSTLGPGVVIRKRDGEVRENWGGALKFWKENFLKEVDFALSPSRGGKVKERHGERNGWGKQDYRQLRSQNIEMMTS